MSFGWFDPSAHPRGVFDPSAHARGAFDPDLLIPDPTGPPPPPTDQPAIRRHALHVGRGRPVEIGRAGGTVMEEAA